MHGDDHDREGIERRVDALERAIAEDEPTERLDRVDRIEELETRIAELEAAVRALRGYVGSVRAVNEEIERRADRAIRRTEALERHVDPATDGKGDDERDDGDGGVEGPLSRLRGRL